MSRNKTSNNSDFSKNQIDEVWKKGTPIPGYEPNEWRRDTCQHALSKSAYGNTNSQYGWEIDHIKPASKGGTDDLSNLQPLYWETNRDKADKYPWKCGQ